LDCHALKQFFKRFDDKKYLNFVQKVMKYDTMSAQKITKNAVKRVFDELASKIELGDEWVSLLSTCPPMGQLGPLPKVFLNH